MNKVYVQVKHKLPVNVDVQNAIDGFEYLGYEVVPVTLTELLISNYDSLIGDNPFVGSIDFMKNVFSRQGKSPNDIDFPNEIVKSGLMNRQLTKTTIKNVKDTIDLEAILGHKFEPFFIKPVNTKLFDGALLSKYDDMSYLNHIDGDVDVWCTQKVDIVSEHRAYIHNGKMIYCCNYSGDFRINPDYNYIDKLISVYSSAPCAYTIDVAVLADSSMTVVEFNDMWAIGGYGVSPWDYAEMLRDRYFEIIK